MLFTLAFLEAASVFAAVCVLIMMRQHPSMLGLGVPAAVAPALAVSGCCLVSFYYNDLYEVGALRDVKKVAPRLLQSLGLTFLLLGASETLLPGVKLSAPLLASTFLVVVGLVVPLRAVSHGLMTRRAAAQRVVILGTGPLACKIVEEIERAPRLPYSVVGMMDDGGPAAAPPWLSGALHPLPVRALEDMERLIGQLRPDRLVVALSERRGRPPVGA